MSRDAAEKKKFIEWIDRVIRSNICDLETINCLRRLKDVYQNEEHVLDEIRGKYIALKDGNMLPLIFDTPSHITDAKLTEYYGSVQIFIPDGSRICDSAQILNRDSHSFGVNMTKMVGGGESYAPAKVDVLLLDNDSNSYQSRYVIDTGASDTSCSATVTKATTALTPTSLLRSFCDRLFWRKTDQPVRDITSPLLGLSGVPQKASWTSKPRAGT